MLDQYRHHMTSSLLSHGPMIRLCLRLLLLLIFATFFYSMMNSVTVSEIASNAIWNPFKERRPGWIEPQKKNLSHNLPPQEDDDDILNEDPKYPRIPDGVKDHIYFSFYDGSRIYTNQECVGGTVSRKPLREEQSMLFQVQARALKFLNTKYPGRFTQDSCNSLRYRTIPTVGIEADVTCNDKKTGSVDRLSLMLPLRPPRVTYHHSIHPSTAINIIMPLRGRLENLKLFMTNLAQILQESPLHVGLTVVYFEDPDEQSVRQILKDTEAKTKNLKTQFILLAGKVFSRGRGLQAGVDQTSLLGEVMFFCDVDVVFTNKFLTRCLSTPVRGHQLYFPMVFSQYNPEFVYPLHKHQIPPPLKQLNVNDNHGYWRLWGHGMVCVYRSDFRKIGGFDVKRTGWGGEDTAFLKKTIATGDYKIIRSLEPGLFHIYHKKDCSDAGLHSACLQVRAMSEASKQSLGFWFFKQTEGISVYGALVEGNQPHYHDDLETDPRETNETTGGGGRDIQTKVVSQYRWLWIWLGFLLLVAVLGLDMFLMIQQLRIARGGSVT